MRYYALKHCDQVWRRSDKNWLRVERSNFLPASQPTIPTTTCVHIMRPILKWIYKLKYFKNCFNGLFLYLSIMGWMWKIPSASLFNSTKQYFTFIPLYMFGQSILPLAISRLYQLVELVLLHTPDLTAKTSFPLHQWNSGIQKFNLYGKL